MLSTGTAVLSTTGCSSADCYSCQHKESGEGVQEHGWTNSLPEEHKLERGARQGEVSLPILFTLYLRGLLLVSLVSLDRLHLHQVEELSTCMIADLP
ncbi:hypothetical protein EVAR_92366_1 [Eumeta japonica]|uniref:Uncharacterized protein n=1 Tax=Eumeta variegata TaxID=151549 RepID=A0A4C1TJV3_EUMVA|nr:hypothetical protein EVAR_92366_1 [Eumeta japonica]